MVLFSMKGQIVSYACAPAQVTIPGREGACAGLLDEEATAGWRVMCSQSVWGTS